MSRADSAAVRMCRWFALAASIVAVVMGGLALAGWLFDVGALTSLVAGAPAMRPTTAVCVILAGFSLALWLRLDGRREGVASKVGRLAARGLAVVMIVLVALALVADAVQASLGFSPPFSLEVLAVNGSGAPERLAHGTGYLLVILALALLLIDVSERWDQRPSQALGLVVALAGLVALEGYLYGATRLYWTTPAMALSLHTAVALVMLGLGVLAVRPASGLMAVVTSTGNGGLLARRLLPFALVLPIVVGWLVTLGEDAGFYGPEIGIAILVTAVMAVLVVAVWLTARGLGRLDAERRLSEDALRAAAERLAKAFQASGTGVALVKLPEQTFEDVNESWIRLTGYERGQIIGKTEAELDLAEPEDRIAVLATLGAPVGLANRQVTIRRKDGDVRYVMASADTLSVDGQTYALGTAVDITDQVIADQELQDTNRRLEAAMTELRNTQRQMIERERIAALGQLANGVAHDFNNALGPILGYSEQLLTEPGLLDDSQAARERLRAIHTAGQDAAYLVGRLRDFYRWRVPSDGFELVDVPTLIADVVSQTRARWRDDPEGEATSIQIETDVDDMPPIRALADELREALLNLVQNAVEALPVGGDITLRAYRSGDQAILEVIDTGTGMTEEVRRRCLESLFTTKGERATGLGLGMVQSIVLRHDGDLEIESAAGRGTTVRLRLPGQPVTGEEVPPLPPPPIDDVLRVLVVDDEPLMQQVIVGLLEIDGHTVVSVAGGWEALSRLREAPFDLLITDRVMPDMNGDELATIAKEVVPGMP